MTTLVDSFRRLSRKARVIRWVIFVSMSFSVGSHFNSSFAGEWENDEFGVNANQHRFSTDAADMVVQALKEFGESFEDYLPMASVLADRDRLLIICNLADGKKSIDELSSLIGANKQELTNQMRILQDLGFTRTRHVSSKVFYRPASENYKNFVQRIYDTLCQPLLERCAPSRSADF